MKSAVKKKEIHKKPKTKRNKRMSIQDKAVLAMKAAVRGVIKQHRETGRPLAIWKDGRVVWISPYTLKEV
ncbi:MAG: hypothetical protein PHD29_04700 [bacterium]|nr:hypothetical protein [bacterium]MDD5756241.1 hypothetical protein [bacterium]